MATCVRAAAHAASVRRVNAVGNWAKSFSAIVIARRQPAKAARARSVKRPSPCTSTPLPKSLPEATASLAWNVSLSRLHTMVWCMDRPRTVTLAGTSSVRETAYTPAGSSSVPPTALLSAAANAAVSSVLGNLEITIREFLDVKIGDVISLDKSVNEQVTILVEGTPKFFARPGLVKKKRGFEITTSIHEGM